MTHNALESLQWGNPPRTAREALRGALEGLSGATAPLSSPLFDAVWEAEDRMTGLTVLTEIVMDGTVVP